MTIQSADIIPSSRALLRSATAAEAIIAGKLVYKVTTKTVGVVDASVSAKSQVAGIAVCTAAAGQPVTYVERDDNLEIGGSHRVGEVYVSDDAGDVIRATDAEVGWRVCAVGVVVAETKIEFRITATDDARNDPTPSAPVDLVLTPGVGSVVAMFSGPADSSQAQVKTGAGDWTDSNPGSATENSIGGLASGNYDFRVRFVKVASDVLFYSSWTTGSFTVA